VTLVALLCLVASASVPISRHSAVIHKHPVYVVQTTTTTATADPYRPSRKVPDELVVVSVCLFGIVIELARD
jgi:hypothetical protein